MAKNGQHFVYFAFLKQERWKPHKVYIFKKCEKIRFDIYIFCKLKNAKKYEKYEKTKNAKNTCEILKNEMHKKKRKNTKKTKKSEPKTKKMRKHKANKKSTTLIYINFSYILKLRKKCEINITFFHISQKCTASLIQISCFFICLSRALST